MKRNQLLEQTLCAKFCAYYKPGKNEELACRGHDVVELLLKGRTLNFVQPEKRNDSALVEVLVHNLCSDCAFQKEDCDFTLDRRAPPCGGFVLLARLHMAGEITYEEIMEALKGTL
jgi:hypothetical protein